MHNPDIPQYMKINLCDLPSHYRSMTCLSIVTYIHSLFVLVLGKEAEQLLYYMQRMRFSQVIKKKFNRSDFYRRTSARRFSLHLQLRMYERYL